MSVKKCIDEAIAPIYCGLNKIANENHDSLARFANKLDEINKRTLYQRIVVVRNWITFVLLCIICVLLLSSCLVSGRNVRIITPKIEVSADTATALSWPYCTKFQ